MNTDHRTEAILTARRLLERQPIYLDCEVSVGVGRFDEVSEIAVINSDGEELVNTFVLSGRGVPSAEQVNAPRFDQIWQAQLREMLSGKGLNPIQPICIYGADFRVNAIRQSLMLYGVKPNGIKPPFCLQEFYALFNGEWDGDHFFPGYQGLLVAARCCGLNCDEPCRALADARLAREILHYIAHQDVKL